MRVREGERECYQKDKHYKKNKTKKKQRFSILSAKHKTHQRIGIDTNKTLI